MIRAGGRKRWRTRVRCEMSCRDVKSSAEVYMCAIRAGVRKRWRTCVRCEMSSRDFKWRVEIYMRESRAGVRERGVVIRRARVRCQVERGGIHVCEQSKCEKEVKDACPR